jgi:hypothetical protein
MKKMTKLTCAMVCGMALCATVKADEPLSEVDQKLLTAVEDVVAIARESRPLAEQEFKVLEDRCKGYDSAHLVFWMYQPFLSAAEVANPDTPKWVKSMLRFNDLYLTRFVLKQPPMPGARSLKPRVKDGRTTAIRTLFYE